MSAAASDGAINGLVATAARGDRDALQKIMDYIHPKVVVYCRHRLSDDSFPGPEDTAQEICMAVLKSIDRFVDRGTPFMSYVYGIASHKVKDGYRSMGRDRSQPTDEIPEAIHDVAGPEELAIQSDGRNKLLRLLDILGERPREIIILRVLEGYTSEETAKIIGSTPNAVRVAQFRAIAKLKKAMAESPDYSEAIALANKAKED
ncbi:RNA polymerase sigma factor ShbA [Corynebacterium kroppenstedtii]|uniref:RNA polymerase sigma factor ShbA n=1 Tax=Corynebacterium pseudokroppenstedtii TaxID=2804917 RepID=UPI0019526F30|nr:RNA polymerase sigma factor ShbA [Corynebacterium pseudokroppenstedtii]MDK7148386.1 RNA polymerase sigma factor ShbA [Corynebacterium pseudokroppenstedtii]QRP14646.1 RNA polymerase sigma factor ShbA [Corynebacterium kroppenstedtii]